MSAKQDTSAPYHVLMLDPSPPAVNDSSSNSPTSARRRLYLDHRLQRDYLARRYRAHQEVKGFVENRKSSSEASPHSGTTNTTLHPIQASPSREEDNDSFWHGATSVERSLAACCWSDYSSPEEHNEDDDNNDNTLVDYEETVFPGAVKNNRMVAFVGRIALHCHDVGERALALAILERTQQVDAYDQAEFNRLGGNGGNVARKRARPKSDDDDDDWDSSGAADEENDEDEMEEIEDSNSPVKALSPSEVHTYRKRRPSRLIKFLKAGGLRILCRWLAEASTPVPAKPRLSSPIAGGSSANDSTMASPTGPLLLPLLQLLQKLPFDRQAITESKINKRIKQLYKELDSILPTTDDEGTQLASANTRTSPFAGGLIVRHVQKALKDVMDTWKEDDAKTKEGRGEGEEPLVVDPFAQLKEKLLGRLRDLEADGTDSAPEITPEWLAKVKEAQNAAAALKLKAAADGGVSAKQLSTKERERQEREKERQRTKDMQKDLEKAQEQRRELLRKLRTMKQNEAAAGASKASLPVPSTRRGVRWKDGLGATSKLRKTELLEEVFIFIKDKDMLAAAEQEEDDIWYETSSADENSKNQDSKRMS